MAMGIAVTDIMVTMWIDSSHCSANHPLILYPLKFNARSQSRRMLFSNGCTARRLCKCPLWQRVWVCVCVQAMRTWRMLRASHSFPHFCLFIYIGFCERPKFGGMHISPNMCIEDSNECAQTRAMLLKAMHDLQQVWHIALLKWELNYDFLDFPKSRAAAANNNAATMHSPYWEFACIHFDFDRYFACTKCALTRKHFPASRFLSKAITNLWK